MTHDDDALISAMARLNRKLGDDVAAVMRAVFDRSGFAWQSDDIRTEIARQLRLKGLGQPVNRSVIADVICATFDYSGFAHDPEDVRAEVGRQLQRRQAMTSGPADVSDDET